MIGIYVLCILMVFVYGGMCIDLFMIERRFKKEESERLRRIEKAKKLFIKQPFR